MGINPGNPAFALPPAEDDFARQLKDLERTTRENLASVVSSFKTTVERLDSAIASIITAENAGGSTQNFAVTTTPVEVASCTLTVPNGYTEALVNVVAFVEAFNDTTGGQYLYVQCSNSVTGGSGEVYSLVPASAAVAVTTFQQVTLTNLQGGQQITCGVVTRAGAAFAASMANLAQVSAQAIYLK